LLVTVYPEPKQIPYHRFLSINWRDRHCQHSGRLGVVSINIFLNYQFVMKICGRNKKLKLGSANLCFAGGCIDAETNARGGITIFTKRDYKIRHREIDPC
jgi:hypothetical protein